VIAFAPAKRDDMERRAAEVKAARRSASPVPLRPRARNLEAIFALDQATFFAFRGRPFGVPPLPWQVGEKLLDLFTRAGDAAARMARGAADGRADRDAMREYFDAVSALPPIIWANSYPASRPLRFLRRLGLMRNPFATATDREIMEIADFFLSRRMKSGVQFSPTPSPERPPLATSSRT
jgi:hypothetical protein